MKRVLVTGASGFVGRHVLAPLAQLGFEVHAVHLRGARRVEGDKIVWHELDLLDAIAVERVVSSIAATHLMHFAWIAEHGLFWTAAENLDWLAASLHLIRVFERAGGQRVVAAGTCAEYDWSDISAPCDEETTRLAPQTLYGTAKNALRTMIEAFSGTRSLQWAWGRLFLIYGPGEHPARLVPSLIRPLLEGNRAQCRSANLVRDLMFVEDAGQAFAHLVNSPFIGSINVASGVAVSLGEVAREIARQCRADDRLDLEEQPSSVSLPATLVAATHRLNSEVGFVPQVDICQGVTRMLETYPALR